VTRELHLNFTIIRNADIRAKGDAFVNIDTFEQRNIPSLMDPWELHTVRLHPLASAPDGATIEIDDGASWQWVMIDLMCNGSDHILMRPALMYVGEPMSPAAVARGLFPHFERGAAKATGTDVWTVVIDTLAVITHG